MAVPILYVGAHLTETILTLAATTVITVSGLATATYYEKVVIPARTAKLRQQIDCDRRSEFFKDFEGDI